MPDSNATILIVDDDKFNRELFSVQLRKDSYTALVAENGEIALRMAQDLRPDLILLDVMMPGLSGFEVAQRLKANPATKNIPIIMVTALDDQKSRLTALEAGAEEFLTKPVIKAELLMRVRNLLKLKKYQDFLASQSDLLEEQLAVGKYHLDQAHERLLQADKLASIGQLAAGVAHEINNPIGFVKSNFSSLTQYVNDLLAILKCYEAVEPLLPGDAAPVRRLMEAKAAADLEFVRQDIQQLICDSQDGITRVAKIVQDLKNFARTDANPVWVTTDLNACLDSTLNIVANEIKYKAEIVTAYGTLPLIECVPSQLGQVFLNILVNAAHAIESTGSPGRISIRTGSLGEQFVWVEISDTGCGMSEAESKKIFDPFYTTKPVGVGTGLGLSISYGIIKMHGGSIDVTSTPGQGSTFKLILPVRQNSPQTNPQTDSNQP